MTVLLGSYVVPARFETVAKYAKFVVTIAALIATVIVATVAGPPAWAYMIIAAATALGVITVPNGKVASVLSMSTTAISDLRQATAAAKAGNVAGAVTEAKAAEIAATGAVEGAEDIAKTVTPEAETEAG